MMKKLQQQRLICLDSNPFFFLLVVAVIWHLLVSVMNTACYCAAAQDHCVFSYFERQSLPHDSACTCDVNGTLCEPNELCFSFPTDDSDVLDNDDDPSTYDPSFQCFKVPCDDLSGTWIWFGRFPRPYSPGDFTVWGTINVQQNNCRAVFSVRTIDGLIEKSKNNGTLEEENTTSDDDNDDTTTTLYASMSWREIYSLFLFETAEERMVYEQNSTQQSDLPPSFDNGYWFSQNFESSAEQCQYVGSFVQKGYYFGNDLPDDENFYSGILARDVDGLYSLGDIIPEAEAPSNENCPPGYPRPWTPPPPTPNPTSEGSITLPPTPNPTASPTTSASPKLMTTNPLKLMLLTTVLAYTIVLSGATQLES